MCIILVLPRFVFILLTLRASFRASCTSQSWVVDFGLSILDGKGIEATTLANNLPLALRR